MSSVVCKRFNKPSVKLDLAYLDRQLENIAVGDEPLVVMGIQLGNVAVLERAVRECEAFRLLVNQDGTLNEFAFVISKESQLTTKVQYLSLKPFQMNNTLFKIPPHLVSPQAT